MTCGCLLCLCHCIWLHRSHWSSPLSEKANADKLRWNVPSYRGSWKILKASSTTCQVTSDINVHCFGAAARAARCELKDLSCKNGCTRKPLLLVVPLIYEFRASPSGTYIWIHLIVADATIHRHTYIRDHPSMYMFVYLLLSGTRYLQPDIRMSQVLCLRPSFRKRILGNLDRTANHSAYFYKVHNISGVSLSWLSHLSHLSHLRHCNRVMCLPAFPGMKPR